MPEAFVLAATLQLSEGCDTGAPGAAVTTALCGHWEHEGPCRWPHNNAVDARQEPVRFRTVFVADAEEATGVEERIRRALASSREWQLIAAERGPLAERDRPLAERLLSGPRAGA